MISQSAQPDPIDSLLEKISKEVWEEERHHLATFLQRAIARIVDTAIVFGAAYGSQLLFVQFVRSANTFNVDTLVKSVEQATPAFALMIWVLVYSPVMESTGGTLGKRLVRIQLVDFNSRQVPLFRMCMARTWIYLVFVVLAFRRRGVSKALMRAILAHPDLQTLRTFSLGTRDAHGLYARFGFEPIREPQRLMAKYGPSDSSS